MIMMAGVWMLSCFGVVQVVVAFQGQQVATVTKARDLSPSTPCFLKHCHDERRQTRTTGFGFTTSLQAKSQRTGYTSQFRPNNGNAKKPQFAGGYGGASSVVSSTLKSPYWLPPRESTPDAGGETSTLKDTDVEREALQHFAVDYVSQLISRKLGGTQNDVIDQQQNPQDSSNEEHPNDSKPTSKSNISSSLDLLLRGQFIDMTYTLKEQGGEQAIETLFCQARPNQIINVQKKQKSSVEDTDQSPQAQYAQYKESQNQSKSPQAQYDQYYNEHSVLKGAIIAMQSLFIIGMQVGVKGSPTQIQRMVAHLEKRRTGSSNNPNNTEEENNIIHTFWQEQEDNDTNTTSSSSPSTKETTGKGTGAGVYIQSLKYERDTRAGIEILARLGKKRTAQGAFDLLVSLGIWSPHEDLSFLRSGFLTRFTHEEEQYAREAAAANDLNQSKLDSDNAADADDLDTQLGLRQDLRHLKAYTIDAASTSEIDDALSVELFEDEHGMERKRYWVHIADADYWAPRDSNVIHAAHRRATSLYLPTGSVPMFPER
jgi:hypothetical protein